MPFIEAAAQIVKWVLIIAAVFVGGALAAGITGFIGFIRLAAYWLRYLGGLFNGARIFIMSFVDWWRFLYRQVSSYVRSIIDLYVSIYHHIMNAKNSIVGFFANAGDWLVEAGKHLIDGLINGIKNKIGDLTGVAKKVAQTIKDHLPFSPAKVGPLSGAGNPYNSGQAIAQLIAAGMMGGIPVVSQASNAIASAVSSTFRPEPGAQQYGYVPRSGVGSLSTEDSASKSTNTTVNVYTQEINPVKNAAELGFMITQRMS